MEASRDDRNTWGAKLKRTLTSFLPVSADRVGSCLRCGACCSLPNRCPFLRFDKEGFAACLIRPFRPLNCRKYPRDKEEQICHPCGYSFHNNLKNEKKTADYTD